MFKAFKINHKRLTIVSTSLILTVLIASIIVYARVTLSQAQKPGKQVQGIGLLLPSKPSGPLQVPGHKRPPTPTSVPPTAVAPTKVPPSNPPDTGPTPVRPSTPGNPTLERLEQVTDQAFGSDGTYVPNSWGVQKNRVIRLSSGDIFTVFITGQGGGSDDVTHHRIWHLMHRPVNGGWQEIKTGDAGAEPINIMRGPHDEIHLFAWPGVMGELHHIESTDGGQNFTDQVIPGQWTNQQGYSGSGINSRGDMVFFQTGDEQPGTILWTYYSPDSNQWQFHISTLDQFRYTYAFIFPGNTNDLTIAAMRDVERPLLGYASASGFNYIFNDIKAFSIGDVNNPNVAAIPVADVQPQSNEDANVTYLTDSYIDTQGRTHLLYNNYYDGPDTTHHVVIDNGQVIKNVTLNVSYSLKARIVQDTLGHFYIITTSRDGNTLNIYPGSASDTDGTQLNAAVGLNIGQYPACTDADFCHSPTFTVPRNGHALADYIDGTYGNFTKEIYFRVQLRSATALSVPVPSSSAPVKTAAYLPNSGFVADEKRRYTSHV